MLKEFFNAKAQKEKWAKAYDELRDAVIQATKGMDEKILQEDEYTAKVKYREDVEYINADQAQKVLPAECFQIVFNKDVVKALEKSGKLDSKVVDKFRKYSYTVPRVTVERE